MGTAYKAAIPGATVTASPGAPCRGRAAAPGSSPRRHASPCAWQCRRSSPIRPRAPGAEHHARWQGGFEERASRGDPTPPPHHRKTTEAGPEALPTSSCRVRACDSSKCRSRWWRSDQPIWTVSVGIRHEPAPAQVRRILSGEPRPGPATARDIRPGGCPLLPRCKVAALRSGSMSNRPFIPTVLSPAPPMGRGPGPGRSPPGRAGPGSAPTRRRCAAGFLAPRRGGSAGRGCRPRPG